MFAKIIKDVEKSKFGFANNCWTIMKILNFLIWGSLVAFLFIACGEDSASSSKKNNPDDSAVEDSVHKIYAIDSLKISDSLMALYASGSSECVIESFDGLYTITCGDQTILAYQGNCDSIPFDPKYYACSDGKIFKLCGRHLIDTLTQFCYEDSVGLDLCDGYEYTPSEQFCHDNQVFELYEGGEYNADSLFCYADSLYELCGGNVYDPSKELCFENKVLEPYEGDNFVGEIAFTHNDSIYKLCGDSIYNAKTHYCLDEKIYAFCSGGSYDVNIYYCYNDSYYRLCGGEAFERENWFCSGNKVVRKCDGNDYNTDKKFCYEDKVYEKCGTKDYNPDNETCVNNVVYPLLIDERDGQKYRYITVHGTNWMAENLNYKVPNSVCGGGSSGTTNEGDCDVYGRLYLWSAAVDSAGLVNENGVGRNCGYISSKSCVDSETIQGVCPKGWHLPSLQEWTDLVEVADIMFKSGLALKSSSSHWVNHPDSTKGTDNYRFSALPAGQQYSYTHEFSSTGEVAFFWTGSEKSDISSWYAEIRSDTTNVEIKTHSKDYAFSIRCVEDDKENSED